MFGGKTVEVLLFILGKVIFVLQLRIYSFYLPCDSVFFASLVLLLLLGELKKYNNSIVVEGEF